MFRIIITFIFFGLIVDSWAQLPQKISIIQAMELANGYFMKKWPDPTAVIVTDKTRPSNLWTRATYYEGLMQLYYLTKNNNLYDYAVSWGSFHKWQPTYVGGAFNRNADNMCCGQTYIELYNIEKKPERIAPTQFSIDSMCNTSKSNDWWWIDALHMAMPVFAKFGVLYQNNKYFEKMYDLYHFARYRVKKNTGLYNPNDKLWYRDSVFLPPTKSPNGLPVYWSRGNGWVFAALVRVLDIMPEKAPHRDEYLTMFKDMASKLITIQREDGFWNPNLGDPNDYGGKETSGTVFFTYGLAWGIRNGYLDLETYLPTAIKAWNGLIKDALHDDGALGYVQSTGSKPADGQPLSYDKMPNFEDYGLGGFLLAGSEMYRLVEMLEKSAISETLMKNNCKLFPNPVTKEMNIASDFPVTALKIFDISGRTIFYQKYNDHNTELCYNISSESLPGKGMYFAEIITTNTSTKIKFLKN
jgi:rhamnogalacturonyl hydrolase YesR